MTGGHRPVGVAAWAAAGVCQEVLLRTLPSLRHDMAGLLSVARMDLALLKRWMAKLATQGADDVAGAAERVHRVDQQFVALLQSLQALQAWGAEEVSDTPSADELLEACLGWIRPVLMLGKVSVDRGSAAPDRPPLAPVSPSAFKYLCLGALWYGVDRHAPALAGMTVTLLPPGGLRVDIALSRDGAAVEAARMPQPVWGRLDEAGLRAVAQHMGWRLEVEPTGLMLWWA